MLANNTAEAEPDAFASTSPATHHSGSAEQASLHDADRLPTVQNAAETPLIPSASNASHVPPVSAAAVPPVFMAPPLPDEPDPRLPPRFKWANLNEMGHAIFTVNHIDFRADKSCPLFSVYDCPPNLKTFLYDCRVSGNSISKQLGEFFPLPGIQLPSAVQDELSISTTMGHAARSRHFSRLAVQQAANCAIATLNHLAGSPLGDPTLRCDTVRSVHLRALHSLLVNTGIFIRECRKHENLRVDGKDWTFDYVVDLHTLGTDSDSVAADPETQRGAYCRTVPDRLSLPPDGAGAKVDLHGILPPEELDPELVLKSTPPSDAELGKIPIVKAYSSADYPKIVARLIKSGIAGISPEKPKCINGLFAVKKDDLHDRFILDGRRANLYFNTPPKVRLPNLADLARIVLLADTKLYAAKADMSNQFYMIACPEAFQTYFGLPHLDVTLELSQLTGLAVGTRVWPRMLAIPMGAAWAVNWAQKAQSSLISASFEGTSVTEPGCLRIGVGALPLWVSYIDDFIVLSHSPSVANAALASGLAALKGVGFVENPKKRFDATHDRFWTPVLGARLSLDGTLAPDPVKIAHVFNMTHNILAFGHTTYRQLMQLVGVWIWFLLLNRPFLSVLFFIYHALNPEGGLSREQLDGELNLHKQVRMELAHLLNIAPLLFADLRYPTHPYLFASDASEEGLGGCWRRTPDGFDLFTPAEKSGWFSKHSEDVPACIATHPTVALACQADTHEWKTAFAVKHRDGAPIVLREALAALGMCLRCQEGVRGPTRYLTLIDSTSLLGAFAKGRSSSGRLNAFCRALAAVQGALESRALFAWVSTDLNPADGPSRPVTFLTWASVKPSTRKVYMEALRDFRDWLDTTSHPLSPSDH